MRNIHIYGSLLVFAVGFVTPTLGQAAQPTSHHARAAEVHNNPYGEQLGTVQFLVSCNDAASQHAERGLALLHHMTYEGARAEFATATEADPDCAMGYWVRP